MKLSQNTQQKTRLWTNILQTFHLFSKTMAFSFHGPMQYMQGNFHARKERTTHFGLYLWHPSTDFGHFFNFMNPNNTLYKFYIKTLSHSDCEKNYSGFNTEKRSQTLANNCSSNIDQVEKAEINHVSCYVYFQ